MAGKWRTVESGCSWFSGWIGAAFLISIAHAGQPTLTLRDRPDISVVMNIKPNSCSEAVPITIRSSEESDFRDGSKILAKVMAWAQVNVSTNCADTDVIQLTGIVSGQIIYRGKAERINDWALSEAILEQLPTPPHPAPSRNVTSRDDTTYYPAEKPGEIRRDTTSSNEDSKSNSTELEKASTQKRVVRRSASTMSTSPHFAGELLATTDLYDLYERRGQFDRLCFKGEAKVSLIFKVDRNYVIADDEAYRNLVVNDLLPVIARRCQPLSRVQVYNYIDGIRLDSMYKEFSAEDPAFRDYEQNISGLIVRLEGEKIVRYEFLGHSESLVGMSERRKREAEQSRKNKERYAEADRKRAAHQAEYQALEKADAERLANTRVTADGRLKVGKVSLDNRELFLNIYQREFIKLSMPGTLDYKPYLMYSGLIQGYSDLCKDSLSKNKIKIDIERTRFLRTEFGLFSNTHYYEKYLAGTIWMEPRYEATYRNSLNRFQEKYLEKWQAERWDGHPLMALKIVSELGTQLAIDSRQLITENKCGNPALGSFIDNLTTFVNDVWDSKTEDGLFKFVEEWHPSGERKFTYGKVPRTFSPKFPSMHKDIAIDYFLDTKSKKPGLEMVKLTTLNLQPMMYNEHEVKLEDKNGNRRKLPDAVAEAIMSMRYFIASCHYLVKPEVGRVIYYWKANEVAPPDEVRDFFGTSIREAVSQCPLSPPAD